MPLLYGERERAFLRLQEELVKKYNDDSILAWGLIGETSDDQGPIQSDIGSPIRKTRSLCPILASSPLAFRNSRKVRYRSLSATKPFTMTNAGLQIELPLVPISRSHLYFGGAGSDKVRGWVGILSCYTGVSNEFLGIMLSPNGSQRDTPTEVHRASITSSGRPQLTRHTVVVGPKTAMRAQHSNIMILQQTESRTGRKFSFGPMHIVVTESQTLSEAGYEVYDAKSLETMDLKHWVQHTSAQWDTVLKVLTVPGLRPYWNLQRFDFVKSSTGARYTVFVRDGQPLVRHWQLSSEEEESNAVKYLGRLTEKTATHSMPSRDRDDEVIKVSVTQKQVSFSCMMEMTIDLIPADEPMSEAFKN